MVRVKSTKGLKKRSKVKDRLKQKTTLKQFFKKYLKKEESVKEVEDTTFEQIKKITIETAKKNG